MSAAHSLLTKSFWFFVNIKIIAKNNSTSDARLICKNKPKMGNSTEKQAQRAFGRKIKKT